MERLALFNRTYIGILLQELKEKLSQGTAVDQERGEETLDGKPTREYTKWEGPELR